MCLFGFEWHSCPLLAMSWWGAIPRPGGEGKDAGVFGAKGQASVIKTANGFVFYMF